MGWAGDACVGRFTHEALERRAVAEIRRKVVKRGGRNAVSRFLQARNDKESIATWRLDLHRVLHVFNMRSEVYVRPRVLSVYLQAELAINTNIAVSDVHRDIVNTQTIVSGIRRGVVNTHVIVSELQRSVTSTHTMVSDIRRTMARCQETTDGKDLPVSVACILLTAELKLTVI